MSSGATSPTRYGTPAITASHGPIVIHLVNKETRPKTVLEGATSEGKTCLDHDMVITDSAGHVLAHGARVKRGH
jgi:hypothetical protein